MLKIGLAIISMIWLELKIWSWLFLKIKKLHENILVYNILYKSLIDSKPLHVRFNKIDGSIGVHDGIDII